MKVFGVVDTTVTETNIQPIHFLTVYCSCWPSCQNGFYYLEAQFLSVFFQFTSGLFSTRGGRNKSVFKKFIKIEVIKIQVNGKIQG